jgi:acyl carrier protein
MNLKEFVLLSMLLVAGGAVVAQDQSLETQSSITTQQNSVEKLSREQIKESVYLIIVDQFGVAVEDVNDDQYLVDDLGADDLDNVELILAIEDKYSIIITDEEAQSLLTVGQIVDLTYKLVNQ